MALAGRAVLDRVCAPMGYGLDRDAGGGLSRYWLWDYASETGSHTLGLVPQQILDLQVLGEVFDPAQFVIGPLSGPVVPAGDLPRAKVSPRDDTTVPFL